MPGHSHVRTRAGVGEAVMPEGPEPARPASRATCATSGPGETGPRPSGSLAGRIDRPVVAGLIALLAALAFALARWQTWAQGNIGRFILVGQHFSVPAQLPHGIPVAPTYGYDGQFFYRLALNPLNLHDTAYASTLRRPS